MGCICMKAKPPKPNPEGWEWWDSNPEMYAAYKHSSRKTDHESAAYKEQPAWLTFPRSQSAKLQYLAASSSSTAAPSVPDHLTASGLVQNPTDVSTSAMSHTSNSDILAAVSGLDFTTLFDAKVQDTTMDDLPVQTLPAAMPPPAGTPLPARTAAVPPPAGTPLPAPVPAAPTAAAHEEHTEAADTTILPQTLDHSSASMNPAETSQWLWWHAKPEKYDKEPVWSWWNSSPQAYFGADAVTAATAPSAAITAAAPSPPASTTAAPSQQSPPPAATAKAAPLPAPPLPAATTKAAPAAAPLQAATTTTTLAATAATASAPSSSAAATTTAAPAIMAVGELTLD
eukprot:TRINITY_DN20565_c0_g1_i1.p1 TRINITY_DN20565_c0_g1~~TRINITY_DN20565_c0_g1_i1.p1  ORF type:complete len:342 (-),score=111.86 TRINITY_DN20565_c0_g1_i1:658-1683(-)